jgi:signal transduction histidine kinase
LAIECRPSQIEQVIINLLNNAFDAVSPLSDKWVRLDFTNFHDKIQIAVTDSGEKISPEIVEKLMLPFFTTKEIGKGTGLGLSISKGIVEDHQGKMYFDSFSSHTRFVVELPINQIKS